ncbi:MAG: CBS domain-containing protein [Rhodobacteraceae bacterium]|nr:CBS domain-containing protein [Paracoccaceae bacterium]
MAPESYRPPLKADTEKERTYTQSSDTNLSHGTQFTRVAQILEEKGNKVHEVAPGDTLQHAIEQLREHKIGAILVVDGGKMVGILSERDVVRELAERGADGLTALVSEAMTADPKTCAPSDPLLNVMKRMSDGNFRHMPVTDIKKELIGLVSIRDVVAFRLREIEYEALKMKQMIIG